MSRNVPILTIEENQAVREAVVQAITDQIQWVQAQQHELELRRRELVGTMTGLVNARDAIEKMMKAAKARPNVDPALHVDRSAYDKPEPVPSAEPVAPWPSHGVDRTPRLG